MTAGMFIALFGCALLLTPIAVYPWGNKGFDAYDEGDFAHWLAKQPLRTIFLLRAIMFAGIGLMPVGVALHAAGI